MEKICSTEISLLNSPQPYNPHKKNGKTEVRNKRNKKINTLVHLPIKARFEKSKWRLRIKLEFFLW